MDHLLKLLKDQFFPEQVQTKPTAGRVGPDAQTRRTAGDDDFIDDVDDDQDADGRLRSVSKRQSKESLDPSGEWNTTISTPNKRKKTNRRSSATVWNIPDTIITVLKAISQTVTVPSKERIKKRTPIKDGAFVNPLPQKMPCNYAGTL